MSNYDASIRVNTKVDTSQMQRLQIQIDKSTDKVERLTNKLEELRNKKAPTEEFAALERKLQSAQEELQKLNDKKAKFVEIGFGEEMLSGTNREISVAQRKIESITAEMQKMKDAGKAFTLEDTSEEAEKVEKELSIAKKELHALLTKQKELNRVAGHTPEGYRKLASSARGAFNTLVTGSRKAHGPLTKVQQRLSSIAMSALLFNQVSRGLNSAVNGAKEGFQNLAKYSSETNKVMSEFKGEIETTKNSLAVAFEPIVTTVVPYLTQFLDVVNSAGNSLAWFLAILSGKNTYKRAKDQMVDYADSINSAGSAAKNALASFDDLNTLAQSGSGSGSTTSPSDMFEEVETGVPDDWTAGLVDAINMGDWESAGKLLAEKLNNAAGQIDYYKIGATIGKGLNNAFAAGNGFLSTIDTRSIGAGFATLLNTAIKNLDGGLVGNTAAQFINRIFDAAFGFLSTYDFVAGGAKLGEIVKGFFANIDLREAGQDVSLLALGILHYIDAAVEEVDWEEVGEKIGDFFEGIEWKEVLYATGDLIWDALKAAIKAYGGMYDAAPIETAILTAIGLLKFTRLGGVLGNVLASSISSASFPVASMNKIATAFSAAFLVAIAGIEFGRHIGAALFPEDAEYYNQSFLEFFRDFFGALNMEDAKGAWREFSKAAKADLQEFMHESIDEFTGLPKEVLTNLWGASDDVFGIKDVLQMIGDGCISIFETATGTASSSSDLMNKLLQNIGLNAESTSLMISGALTFVSDQTDTVTSDITTDWQDGETNICSAVDGITSGMQASFESTYDNVITKTNSFLDELHRMFDDYSVGVSGMAIGGAAFVGEIPRLATGGIAVNSTLANIGEAGREAVLPLENNTEWMDMLADKIGTDRPIVINFEGNLAQLGRVLKPVIDAENRRVGHSFLKN